MASLANRSPTLDVTRMSVAPDPVVAKLDIAERPVRKPVDPRSVPGEPLPAEENPSLRQREEADIDVDGHAKLLLCFEASNKRGKRSWAIGESVARSATERACEHAALGCRSRRCLFAQISQPLGADLHPSSAVVLVEQKPAMQGTLSGNHVQEEVSAIREPECSESEFGISTIESGGEPAERKLVWRRRWIDRSRSVVAASRAGFTPIATIAARSRRSPPEREEKSSCRSGRTRSQAASGSCARATSSAPARASLMLSPPLSTTGA